MLFRIKARLVNLGKKQVDLIPELEKMDLRVNPTELSQAVNVRNQQKKTMDILSASNEIVLEWEQGQTIAQ